MNRISIFFNNREKKFTQKAKEKLFLNILGTNERKLFEVCSMKMLKKRIIANFNLLVSSFFFCFLILIGNCLFAQESKLYVLCYHTFLDNNKSQYNVSPDEFEKQIKAYKEMGYTFVSLQDIENGTVSGNKNILLTIDDGNKSILQIDEKVLKPNNIKPVLFIYPNIIGKKDYVLNWDQLKTFVNQGYTIGAHGYFHLFINQKLYDKNSAAFKMELFKSKEELEKRLGITVIALAYPFGVYSPITVDYTKKAGYKYAFTIKQKSLSYPFSSSTNFLEMPRYMLTKGSWKYVEKVLKGNSLNAIKKEGKKSQM